MEAILDFFQSIARAVNCKRWLLGILMLFAKGQKDSQNSCGAAKTRFCNSRLQQGDLFLHVAIKR
jgi:hypothetical protein